MKARTFLQAVSNPRLPAQVICIGIRAHKQLCAWFTLPKSEAMPRSLETLKNLAAILTKSGTFEL